MHRVSWVSVADRPTEVPLQLERVFATDNVELDIDGLDDARVSVESWSDGSPRAHLDPLGPAAYVCVPIPRLGALGYGP